MTPGKIASIVGFAVRAGKAVYGLDGIERAGARVRVIIRCPESVGGFCRQTEDVCGRARHSVIASARALSEIVHRDNCKAIVIPTRRWPRPSCAIQTKIFRENLRRYSDFV